MLDVIDLLGKEQDTRDELGIGTIRDAAGRSAIPWHQHDPDSSYAITCSFPGYIWN